VPTDQSILVLEDDKDIRDSVVEILEEEGYAVRGFTNGAEALAYLRSGGKATIILLDVMMPVMDGPTFRLELEKDTALSSIPVILLTADSNARRQASTLGVSDVLIKPVSLDDLLSAVQRHCGAARTPA
jgi:CheY-like chemotaxis protein